MTTETTELETRVKNAEDRAALLEKILSRVVSHSLGFGGVLVVTEKDLVRWHPPFLVEPHMGGYKLSFAPFKMVPTSKQP